MNQLLSFIRGDFMGHIGKVVRQMRMKSGLSRSQLAKGICSEKYLYLIEKGERTPSSEMARLIGGRLGVDLYQFYLYLDCADPVEMLNVIRDVNICIRASDIKEMMNVAEHAAQLPDFQKKPWSYYVDLCRYTYRLLIDGDAAGTIAGVRELLLPAEPKYLEEDYILNLEIVLSTAYQIIGEVNQSKMILERLDRILENKKKILRYYQVIVTTRLNQMTLYHLTKEYELAIKAGHFINQFHLDTDTYERSAYVYYYLAYAYYKLGDTTTAVEWFQKCLYTLLVHHNPVGAYYITHYDAFEELFQNPHVGSFLTDKIKQAYNLQ